MDDGDAGRDDASTQVSTLLVPITFCHTHTHTRSNHIFSDETIELFEFANTDTSYSHRKYICFGDHLCDADCTLVWDR